MANQSVTENQSQHRFELPLDGGKTAYVEYKNCGDSVLELTHTEVPAGFEGQGIGGKLLQGAFEVIKEKNYRIVAVCGFVAKYVERHPEYQSLVANR